MADRWITKNGRRILIRDGGGPGKVVAAGLVTAMLAGGGGVGGGAGISSVGARSFTVNKASAKKAARKGKPGNAWRRMGMRRLKRTDIKRYFDCVRFTWGEVQQSAIRNPCTSLDRRLVAITDGRGNTALIKIAWVKFHTSGARRRFQEVIDVHGTGDIKPRAVSLLWMRNVRFTGRYYHSIARGRRLTVAEAEAVGGSFSPAVLDGFAQVAAVLPGPRTPGRR